MKGKKTVIFFLLAICICLFPARNAEAAVKYKNCFVKAQNGNLSYYNAKCKKHQKLSPCFLHRFPPFQIL